MDTTNFSHTIIIPALNEETRIGLTLEAYAQYFNSKTKIVVIDNGSVDATGKVVQKIQEKYPWIHYIRYDYALGKGGAVYAGFDQAQTEFVGFIDADGAIMPAEYAKLMAAIPKGDLIIASRWIKGARISKSQPFVRIISGRVFNLLVNILFRLNLKDTQCGAKIIRKSFYERIKSGLTSKRWSFDVDLLYQVKKHVGKIIEVPIVWEDRTGSYAASYRSLVSAVIDIIKIRYTT